MIEHEVCRVQKVYELEAPYKRKKMESAESKIGPWLDASRDQNSENFVYFSE